MSGVEEARTISANGAFIEHQSSESSQPTLPTSPSYLLQPTTVLSHNPSPHSSPTFAPLSEQASDPLSTDPHSSDQHYQTIASSADAGAGGQSGAQDDGGNDNGSNSNEAEEFEYDEYDSHRRRINSYFSKEQEDEFERIFERELEAGQKYTRRELRETARALKIAPGGELKLFRWFENRRAWMKQRTKRSTREIFEEPIIEPAPKSSTSSSSSAPHLIVKRRRLAQVPQQSLLYLIDLTMTLSTSSALSISNHMTPYEGTSMIQPTESSGVASPPQVRVSAVTFHSTSVGSVLTSPLLIEPNGRGVADLSLKSVVCPGVIIDCSEYLSKKREHNHPIPNAIDCDAFPAELSIADRALVLHTGFHQVACAQPFLTETAAKVLTEKNLSMVAIDCPSIDPPIKPGSSAPPALGPSKMLLLQNRVTVLENLAHVEELLMTLNSTRHNFTLHAAPLPLQGVAAFPVRVYAVLL